MAIDQQVANARRGLWLRPTLGVMIPTEFPLGMPSRVEVFQAAQLAESAGIEALWVGDHVLWHCPILDSLSVLAALAAATKSAVIGSCVLILPLRNPVLLAKAVSTIDLLSGGRMVLGLGVGGENPAEFAAAGIPYAERGARANDAIRILRSLFDGTAVGDSEFWSLEGVRIEPQPAQGARLPFLIGGRSESALRRAGALGDGWVAYFVTPDRFARSRQMVDEEAVKAGRDPSRLLHAMVVFCRIDRDEARARRHADDWLSAQFKLPFERLKRYAIYGSPEGVVDSIADYLAAGVQHLIVCPVGADIMGQLAYIANDVFPMLRRSFNEFGRDMK